MPRILVDAPNWIGDALMAQPQLARLREKLPHLRIDVLAPAWVVSTVAATARELTIIEEVIFCCFSASDLRHYQDLLA